MLKSQRKQHKKTGAVYQKNGTVFPNCTGRARVPVTDCTFPWVTVMALICTVCHVFVPVYEVEHGVLEYRVLTVSYCCDIYSAFVLLLVSMIQCMLIDRFLPLIPAI